MLSTRLGASLHCVRRGCEQARMLRLWCVVCSIECVSNECEVLKTLR